MSQERPKKRVFDDSEQPLIIQTTPLHKKTKKASANDEIRRMYDFVEEDRCNRDVIYAFIQQDKKDVRLYYLKNLITVIMDTYGKDIIKCPSNPQGVGGLSKVDRIQLEEIINMDDNQEYPQISLFLISFYLLPSFLKYFTIGNVERGEMPPPLADRQKFDLFVRTALSERCEDLFNGTTSTVNDSLSIMADPITIFVESTINDYIKICGLPTLK